jgi:hypothetical protein
LSFARQLGTPSILGVVMTLLSRKVRKQANALGVRYEFFFMRASGSQLRELGALYDAGVLRPVIDSTYPFEQTSEAIAYVEQGRTKAGKVVVTMHSAPEPGRRRSDDQAHLSPNFTCARYLSAPKTIRGSWSDKATRPSRIASLACSSTQPSRRCEA